MGGELRLPKVRPFEPIRKRLSSSAPGVTNGRAAGSSPYSRFRRYAATNVEESLDTRKAETKIQSHIFRVQIAKNYKPEQSLNSCK